jgi:exopolysaccharide production protein ExoQ
MSFAIGLGLSVFFSLIVIWCDRRTAPDVSWEIWLPTIWFMLAISKPLSYWANPSSFSEVYSELDYMGGSVLDRTVLTLLMAAALFVLLNRKSNWPELIRNNNLLLFMIVFMAVSILWSDYKAVALKRYLRALGDVLMALIVVSDKAPLSALKKLISRAAYILLPLSIVMIRYFRILGVAYTWDGKEMWVGVTSQKNSLGILSCVVAVFFLSDIVSSWRDKLPALRRVFQVLFLGIGMYLLLGSRSATSLGAFVIGSAILLSSFALKNYEKQIDRLYFLLLIGAIVVYMTMLERIVGAFGRDMTFTSRTVIWEELLRVGSRHPLLGVGYGSVWIGELGKELWAKLGVNVAHNGYIEIYVQLGLVGLALLGLVFVQIYVNIRRKREVDFYFGVLSMTYFVMTIISNITESSLWRSTDMLWILCLCISIQPPQSLLGNDASSHVHALGVVPRSFSGRIG